MHISKLKDKTLSFRGLSSVKSKRTPLTKMAYSLRAGKYKKAFCEGCHAMIKLQVHHVDQDKTNNTSENIQTLCKNCHDFWHSTAKRCGWVIAGRMPVLK